MKTQQDAVDAIRQLLADLEQNPDAWENPTLERFLDAAAAWLEGSGKKDPTRKPSWELIINIFQAAKIYE